jgi:hypothetical protein
MQDRVGLEGNLTWLQQSEFLAKNKLAESHGLGPFRKAIKGSTVVNASSSSTSVPVKSIMNETALGSALQLETFDKETFDGQRRFHDEVLKNNLAVVRKQELYEIIEKARTLGNDFNSRAFLSYWKLK